MGASMFGFTDDKRKFDEVVAFREAAVGDGWEIKPISSEPIDRWAELKRDGFVMHAKARTQRGKWKYEAQITIWGPDGLAIETPLQYSFAAIAEGVMICGKCGAKDVETQRVGFANRCCAECAPSERKRIETPGWCD